MKYVKIFCSLYMIVFIYVINDFFINTTNASASDAPSSKPAQSKKYRLDGEYGLWIENKDKGIIVHWITMDQDSGYLRVVQNKKVIFDTTTIFGYAHTAKFKLPEKKDIKIQYGQFNDKANLVETTLFLNTDNLRTNDHYHGVDTIYAIGDVHGQYDRLIELLQKNKLIDDNLNWIAGKSHFVFLGDIFDRGHDVTKTLWFIYSLEKKANKQGGKVHLLIGNHELLAFQNDLRYTSGKEKLIAHYFNTQYATLFHPRESLLGQWLTSKPGILKINDILFAHGGITPYYSSYNINEFNDSLYTFLHEQEIFNLQENPTSTVRGDSVLFARRFLFLMGEESVFWHRGYVLTDTLEQDLDTVLERYKTRLHVVGHSAVPAVRTFYGGKLVGVDLVKSVTEMLMLIRSKRKNLSLYRCTLDGTCQAL